MSRIYTTEIQGSQCIGDSLSTINVNFTQLDNAIQNIQPLDYVLPTATPDTKGGVIVGQGLTISVGGVLSLHKPVTFGQGFNVDVNNYVTANIDNTTIGIRDGYMTVIPSQQELWVASNSARLMQDDDFSEWDMWVASNSARLQAPFAGTGIYEVILFDYSSSHTDTYIEPVIGGVNNDVVLTPGHHVYDGSISFIIYATQKTGTYSVTVDGVPHVCGDGVNITLNTLPNTSYLLTISNTSLHLSHTLNITMGSSDRTLVVLN